MGIGSSNGRSLKASLSFLRVCNADKILKSWRNGVNFEEMPGKFGTSSQDSAIIFLCKLCSPFK